MLKNKDKKSKDAESKTAGYTMEIATKKKTPAVGVSSNKKSGSTGASSSAAPVKEASVTQQLEINKKADKLVEDKKITEKKEKPVKEKKEKPVKEKKEKPVKEKKEKPVKEKKEKSKKKSKKDSEEIITPVTTPEEQKNPSEPKLKELRDKVQTNNEFTQEFSGVGELNITQENTLNLDKKSKRNRKQNKVLKLKKEVEVKYKDDLEKSIKTDYKAILKEEVKEEYKRELYGKKLISIAKGNKYIRNALLALVLTVFFLLIDLTLKHFFFDFDKASGADGFNYADGQYDWNIKVVAGRSLLHSSTTFLDFMGLSLPKWAILFVNLLIAGLFLLMILLSKSKAVVVGLAIALAGVFGNTMDNFFQDGVRDIFVTPWWDKGTFNLADVLVVIGSVFAGMSFFWVSFRRA